MFDLKCNVFCIDFKWLQFESAQRKPPGALKESICCGSNGEKICGLDLKPFVKEYEFSQAILKSIWFYDGTQAEIINYGRAAEIKYGWLFLCLPPREFSSTPVLQSVK